MPADTHHFNIGAVEIGGPALLLIAGPCVIESESHVLKMAEAISRIAADAGCPYIFKASFDKANRTSIQGYRGPGLEKGLEILTKVKSNIGCPVLTDVHEVHQVRSVAEAVDILQIPAFLCRQTDLIVEAARTGKPVNIKKGQFLAPGDVKNIIVKAASQGNERIILTERGTSFGYNNLVVDFRGFPILKSLGYPVVYDVTHSLQRPGGLGEASGGDPQFIENMARAGVACGIDGIFMEVHDNPAAALSDGPNSLPLEKLENLLRKLAAIHELIRE